MSDKIASLVLTLVVLTGASIGANANPIGLCQ